MFDWTSFRVIYMLDIAWTWLMPIGGAFIMTYVMSDIFFPNRPAEKAFGLHDRYGYYSDRRNHYLSRTLEYSITKGIIAAKNVFDVEQICFHEMSKILHFLGIKRRPDELIGVYISKSLLLSLPVLILPIITGWTGYLFLYLIMTIIITYRQYNNLLNEYRKKRIALKKDIPHIIDKLRISFASGKDHIAAFHQIKESTGKETQLIIESLLNDFQYMLPQQALDNFSTAFKMPVVNKFCSAMRIALENGYEAAENYFQIIEKDVYEVRQIAIEELTKSKPEKVQLLYIIMLNMASGALLLKGWEIFSQISNII